MERIWEWLETSPFGLPANGLYQLAPPVCAKVARNTLCRIAKCHQEETQFENFHFSCDSADILRIVKSKFHSNLTLTTAPHKFSTAQLFIHA